MKGVTAKGNRYIYERAWPKAVKPLAPANKFRMALGLSVGASESEIAKAALVCAEAFDLEVAKLTNSSAEAASEALYERKTQDAIRRLGASAGQFDTNKFQIKTYKGDYPEALPKKFRLGPVGNIHFFGGVIYISEDEELTPEVLATAVQQAAVQMSTMDMPEETDFDREIKGRVKQRLSKRSSGMPKTLSALWEPYCEFRDYKIDQKDARYRKKWRDWSRTLAHVGDHPLVDATDKEINRGVREFVELMLDKGNTPDSAKRAVSMALGCFRWAADEYELDWNIRQLRIKARDKNAKARKTAIRDQMIQIARAAGDWNDHIACIAILALHGMIPSEIAAIQTTSTLDSKIPHLILPEGKTVFRKRAVVTCFHNDILWEHLDEAIAYCRSKLDNGGGSATLNKRINALLGKDSGISTYGLRHGCRNAYVLSGASTPILNAALGWAGAEGGGMHLRYGAEGIDSSEFLKALRDAGMKAHKPIIKALA